MKKLIIARHGAKGAPVDPRDIGTAWGCSAPLTDVGIAEARALGAKLASERVTLAVSSDLPRAIQTREVAVPHVQESRIIPALGPRMQLSAWEEFYATKGDTPVYASSFVRQCCVAALESVTPLLSEVAEGEVVFVVSHSPLVEGMITLAQGGWPPEITMATGSGVVLGYQDGEGFLWIGEV